MNSEFFESTIGEQITLQRGFDITKNQQILGKIPVVSSGGISSFHNEFKVKGCGVVLGRKGTLGTVFYLKENFWPHDTSLWVKDFKGNDPRFVYYFFLNISSILKSMDVGAANPALNRNHVHPMSIIWTSHANQKAIAHILGTLDDKIELNRQMNQTLEAMAQALFKSWFVDFDPVMDNALATNQEIPDEFQAMAEKRRVIANRNVIASGAKQSHQPNCKRLINTNPELAALFPSSFEYNETLGKWIPEGWEVKSLSKLVKLIGGGTPKTTIEEYWNGDIPWFSVVDAPNDSDVFVIDTEKKVSKEGVKNSSTQILREGTTIISARGTVGKCAIVGVAMAMNQSCYGIQGLHENEDVFTYLLVRKNVSDLQNKSHGSVFSTITRDTFSAIDIVVPPSRKIIKEFENSIKSSFYKIKSNLFENQTITQLRDTLLPQLISGKVRVKESK